jgi:hypothetical protein
MKFDDIINNILKEEEISREDRIKALKSIPELKPIFKFNYVTWDWKQSQPNEELERFNDREKFPFVYESSLGSDAYFVFFSDILCYMVWYYIVFYYIISRVSLLF